MAERPKGEVVVTIHHPVQMYDPIRYATRALEAQYEARVAEHRRGEHPWGCMRRDCPLCRRSA